MAKKNRKKKSDSSEESTPTPEQSGSCQKQVRKGGPGKPSSKRGRDKEDRAQQTRRKPERNPTFTSLEEFEAAADRFCSNVERALDPLTEG